MNCSLLLAFWFWNAPPLKSKSCDIWRILVGYHKNKNKIKIQLGCYTQHNLCLWNDMVNPKIEGICNAYYYTKGIMFLHFSFARIMLFLLFFTIFFVCFFWQSVVFCFVPHNVLDNSLLCFSLDKSVRCFVLYNVIDKFSFFLAKQCSTFCCS